jgi:predicted nucleic acid-binding protein
VPFRSLLLDSCVAINLMATDSVERIVQVLDTTFLMVDQAASDMGHLRDEIDGELVTTPIEVNRYVSHGVVQLLSIKETELEPYLELATLVDDGEAATIAIAASRRLQIATDDRKARRVCASYGIPDPARTLGILRAYADAVSLTDTAIRAQLRQVLTRASYRPSRRDPDYKWWSSHVEEA